METVKIAVMDKRKMRFDIESGFFAQQMKKGVNNENTTGETKWNKKIF